MRQMSLETSLMLAAQQLVDNWFRSTHRGPFSRAVAREQMDRWHGEPNKHRQSVAFGRLASAIRVGRGHALDNPAPLITIARDALTDESGT